MATYVRTWWGREWIEAFMGFYIGENLLRGWKLANSGKVIDVVVNNAEVKVKVLSGRYVNNVQLDLSKFSKNQKDKICKIITESPTMLAALVNKKLPAELPTQLKEHGIELFYNGWDATCTC